MIKIWQSFKSRFPEDRLKTNRNRTSGLFSTLRSTLLCSRVMGLFPLSGLSHPTSEHLRFTARSPLTIFYVISLFGQFLMFATSFYWLLQKGISLKNVTNSIFYTSSLVSSLILMNIGRHWPKFLMRVEEIEAGLPPFSRDVAKTCNITMVCILFGALVEHFLSFIYGVAVANSCTVDNIAETFFHFNIPWIFDYTPFTIWKGVLTVIFNVQSTFIWSFNDVLIMVISIYLTEYIIMHNELLKKAIRENNFSASTFRLQFLRIVRLVKIINGKVGIYILTSFASNLYFICTQLFYSMNKTQTGHFDGCQNRNPKDYGPFYSLEHTVYFNYSFFFLVVRTMLVLLLAARIHSNSRVPLVALYNLPSENYDVEVERYIAQINSIKVALSGLDFFYVTRTMILTLLGTIVTYELVLLQFNK